MSLQGWQDPPPYGDQLESAANHRFDSSYYSCWGLGHTPDCRNRGVCEGVGSSRTCDTRGDAMTFS